MKRQLLAGLLALGMGLSAQAALISGAITFKGGVELDTSSVNTATRVTGWLDQSSALPTVASRSGDFATFVATGATTTFAAPWNFNSGAVASFWTVGGFTFNLTASSIVSQGGGFLNVSGTGFVSGNGFSSTLGSWSFSTQDPSAGSAPPVFSFSASSNTNLPDGGSTVALLGLALVGVSGLRRTMTRKS